MALIDWIVLGLLIAFFVFLLVFTLRRRRRGIKGGCAGCPMAGKYCDNCPKKDD